MARILVFTIIVGMTQFAAAQMEITEWMYSGDDGEFIEFTNVGASAIDMTGWSFDDDSLAPGAVDLSAFGVVEPGESVILTEALASDFASAWGLIDVSIIGELSANLGRGDQINLFDASNSLVDQLTYGDEDYPGTPRTKDASCNIPAAGYAAVLAQTDWTLATVGDAFGSWESAGGDIASPGVVPEPVTLLLLLVGGLTIVRRR